MYGVDCPLRPFSVISRAKGDHHVRMQGFSGMLQANVATALTLEVYNGKICQILASIHEVT
jgi:hypothetical protein